MRQIVFDTETTGLEAHLGHRIIEIGCVELVSRRATGRTYHTYLNPERDIDEGARAIHGMSREQLAGKPRFADVAAELIEFLRGAELIIHNAAFDVAFLDAELAGLAGPEPKLVARQFCTVLDTLTLARELHPGQRNSLDALCKRYGVDNSHRDLHGALLDARILADVYLAMTGGQNTLAFGDASRASGAGGKASGGAARRAGSSSEERAPPIKRSGPLPLIRASEMELAAHAECVKKLEAELKGPSLWRELN